MVKFNVMDIDFIQALGFAVKDGASGVYIKTYSAQNIISVDFTNQIISYGKIKAESKTTQNFSQAENWVVLECVNRLLTCGYPPESITLEKTWPAGHGTSGRLDICVARADDSDYLLIECKTSGREYEKAKAQLLQSGGQLFTYFKFSNQADLLMLYASKFADGQIIHENEIVKIDDSYRAGDVKSFYNLWDTLGNKRLFNQGVFDAPPYQFKSKALIYSNLIDIQPSDSGKIFNQFLEILRHNVVSDKPNAFNKIFTLFLCKIYDEKMKDGTDKPLDFQWLEGEDDAVSFQFRLTDLYREGMWEFLERKVTDLSKKEFDARYAHLDDNIKKELTEDYINMRLKKNNEFAIKEVFDENSFKENAKIVKEVVQLLQGFKLRYAKKQQYLSDFFELLLTTGLKQEVGQYFTTVPVAQFMVRSIPFAQVTQTKLALGKSNDLLPFVIDYAAGSGHFITEAMHEMQSLIKTHQSNLNNYNKATQKELNKWEDNPYDWAIDYVYGVEKDYRLVRVGKVGCYLHGDGLANVILSDGLGSFTQNHEFKNRLKRDTPLREFPQDNPQFDILLSNPPYAISAFRDNASGYYSAEDFSLYDALTAQSSEIEALFIERAKQLVVENGYVGIILPASILSNGGIYERVRAIILEYFTIIAITKLGNNAFMETGTNTVILFLKRRSNYLAPNLKTAIDKYFKDALEVAMNGIDQPVQKYLSEIWAGLSIADYTSLVQKKPNSQVQIHSLFTHIDSAIKGTQKKPEQIVKRGKLTEEAYQSKIAEAKAKIEAEYWQSFLRLEAEKLFYFILAYPQQVVVVDTGEKEEEKQFLGYTFSKRRGDEGIHPYRGDSIEKCTRLFDPDSLDNPEKASTYIQMAFAGDFTTPIAKNLEKNIQRYRLIDLLSFDNANFDKSIKTTGKKKASDVAAPKSKWEMVRLGEVAEIMSGGTPSTRVEEYWGGDIAWITLVDSKQKYITKTQRTITREGLANSNTVLLPINTVVFSSRATIGDVSIAKIPLCTNQGYKNFICQKDKLHYEYLYFILQQQSKAIESLASGMTYPEISTEKLSNFKIPLPPLDIQKKIVSEIEAIEKQEVTANANIAEWQGEIKQIFNAHLEEKWQMVRLGEVLTLEYGSALPEKQRVYGNFPVVGSNGIVGYHYEFNVKGPTIVVGRKGSAGAVTWINENCTPIDTTFFISTKNTVNLKWTYYLLLKLNLLNLANRVGVPGLNRNDAYSLQIPLPPLEIQQQIVREIEAIEEKINLAKAQLAQYPELKNKVLNQYLIDD